ncbi:hypothetical protein DFH07DRAFT_818367 [Mycena maculata]|uniref:SP-RING-type domain-containing protein n=1 Tax=Mycena maculata TaxID=230809 RepID=A0AAD7NFF3_9AGAR|nr:hypothetical protein DFH07DRAFT_818367 [Mycena maculata]
MPVATSTARRRKTARQASSDIEEDQPTQRGNARDEVDEDEDDAPQRKVKKEKLAVKKEKGISKAKEDLDEDEDDEDDRIDIANFADQPLPKSDCNKLTGYTKDWSSIEDIMHQPSPIIGRVAASIAEVAGEEAQEPLSELDRVMKSLLDVQAVMAGHNKVLSDMIQSVALGKNITDAKDLYLSLVDEMNAEYDSKTTRQKYAKNDQYVAFKEAIYEVDHPGNAMPPITDFIPREANDESDDDDDVVMGGVTQEYKCPLMMTLLKDPLTSTVCQHSFSGDAIREMFKKTRGALKCPAAGCSKSFTLGDCKPNPELARKVKAYERRQARAQEDSDAEEVID